MGNEFNKDLDYSESQRHEPFWTAVYSKAFPNLVNHMPCPGDYDSQRQGIDRVLLLSNGKAIKIDEKARRKDWGDIALEYVSNDRTGAPGWIEKDLSIDYLAYGFVPSKRCYLLPWQSLRLAWEQNKVRWFELAKAKQKGFRIVPAKNPDYTTWSVAVPINALFLAVNRAMRVDVD